MADKLKQIPQKLLDIWKSWSVKQRVLIIGSIVAFIAVVGGGGILRCEHSVNCAYKT